MEAVAGWVLYLSFMTHDGEVTKTKRSPAMHNNFVQPRSLKECQPLARRLEDVLNESLVGNSTFKSVRVICKPKSDHHGKRK